MQKKKRNEKKNIHVRQDWTHDLQLLVRRSTKWAGKDELWKSVKTGIHLISFT